MAALAGGAATGMYAGTGVQEGKCPWRAIQRAQSILHRCRNRALWSRTSLSTHAATCACRLPSHWGGTAERGGVLKPARLEADDYPGPGGEQTALLTSLEDGPASGLAKTTSVIDTITRQARFACRYLSLRILTIQSCIIAPNPITTAGATLIGARTCIHVSFHRICNERGRWSAPLCKISF